MNDADRSKRSLRSSDASDARRLDHERFFLVPDNETTSDAARPTRRRGSPPTIGDVARLAGTSEATVSRALRGSRRVGEELRLSVVQAAKALDYTPNPHAQALARSTDAAIGVVVHDTGDPYFVEILRGILGPAEESGRMVMVCDTRRDPELEFGYVRHFRTQRVQALLLAGSGFEDREFGAQMTSEISAFERSGARVALIGRHHILGDAVVPDNEDGAYQMARALVDLGHRRIGVISGPPSLTTTQDRLAGIRRALAEAGIDDERVQSGDFTRDRGAAATEELLDATPDITAIFSLNDMMAIGALSVARRRGLRVPDDISIAGFDDIPIATDVWPALSTVQVPMVEMGTRALQLALGPPSSNVQVVRLPTTLALRDSTGPARV
jgi:LacI family transcriptional regulator